MTTETILTDTNLCALEKMALYVLTTFAEGNDRCCPSQRLIGVKMGKVSVSVVSRTLRVLEAKGYIEITRKARPTGKGIFHEYTLAPNLGNPDLGKPNLGKPDRISSSKNSDSPIKNSRENMTTTLPLEVLKLVGKEFFLQGGCSEEFPVIEAVEQEISELKGCFGISDRNVVQLFTWLRDNNKDYAYLQYHAAGVIDKMLAWKNTPKEVRSPGGYFLSAVMEGWQHLKELPKAKPTVYEVICPTCGHRVYRGDTHCLYCNAAVSKEIWHDSEDSAETR